MNAVARMAAAPATGGAARRAVRMRWPGAAVGRLQAQAGLLDLDGAPAGGADHAVGLADQVAAGQQQLLQFAPFGPAQAGVVGGPGGDQAGATAQAVGEQGDRQRVAFGGVVGVDRVVVAEHQECRAGRTGRQQQGGRGFCGQAGRRQRLAVGAEQAGVLPGLQRLAPGAAGLAGVEAGGQADFHTPGTGTLPAGLDQIVGGGGQRVGNAGDQVAAAVAVAVHRDAGIGRGHELGLPEGAGPGAGQAIRRQIALLQQAEQGKQFATEERLATARARQRSQRDQQRALAGDTAVVALHAPDRHDGGRIDPGLFGQARKQIAVGGQHGLAVGDALTVDQAGEVVPDRGGEFGLGIEQRQHAGIGRQAGGEALEVGGRHALGGGLGLQAGQAAVEGRIGAGDQRRQRQQRRQDAPGRHHGTMAGVWTEVMRWSAPAAGRAAEDSQPGWLQACRS
ncbi:UDP-N-acetylmuramyl tripeptide synthase [Xanthomonas arboricola pv. pruni str. MAFF 311562]|uniref:UDP-N-acetylmuramyl tripeptide synthase n=1 Tax=Xanthomonas arboricola pv. pruni str. MAFF 311562 TaxID=1414836 RepID=W4S986_9XANT|nr:UDP-N-acetylmuramyl tripeptide synthase [Xanthomonas arboricola pv. pruni str. MAFF 311562]